MRVCHVLRTAENMDYLATHERTTPANKFGLVADSLSPLAARMAHGGTARVAQAGVEESKGTPGTPGTAPPMSPLAAGGGESKEQPAAQSQRVIGGVHGASDTGAARCGWNTWMQCRRTSVGYVCT